MENEILAGIVIAIVSTSIGWALSQATTGRKVATSLSRMELSMQTIANDTHRAQDEIAAVRSDTTTRITSMNTLVTKVLETADKLIDLVRVQNALLADKERHR